MPSMADLRRYELEKEAKEKEFTYPWEEVGIPTVEEPWTPPGGVHPIPQYEWWETEEGYEGIEFQEPEPEVEVPGFEPWPTGISRFEDEGLEGTAAVSTAPEEPLNAWAKVWTGVKRRIEKIADIASTVVEGVEKQPLKEVPHILNVLWGEPTGLFKEKKGPRGVVWSWMLEGPANALRRVVGFISRQNKDKAPLAGMELAMALASGQYGSIYDDPTVYPFLEGEERVKAAQEARQKQQEYADAVQQAVSQGKSVSAAHREALEKTLSEIQQATLFTQPKELISALRDAEALEAFARGERTLPWTAEAEEDWKLAAGYRYSHTVKPELAAHYEKLVDQGWDPEEAGQATEDPIVENMMLLVMDPNWMLQLDNLAIRGPWEVAKGIGRGVLEIGTKIPIVNKPIYWALSLSAQTMANYAARYTDDALRRAAAFLREAGEGVTDEALVALLKDPPDEFLSAIPRYYRRAVRGAQPYLDEVAGSLKRAFKAGERVLSQITDPVIRAAKEAQLLDEALEVASKRAYRVALEEAVEQNPWLVKGFSRWLKKRWIYRAVHWFNSVAVDTWLGLRPSWNIFNTVDNMVKLVIDGLNPFTSIPSMIRRYAAYIGDTGRWADDVESLRKIRFWNLGKGASDEYVSILQRNMPRQLTGSFAAGIGKRPSFLRKVPGVGKIIDWNVVLGERIEMTFRTRAYLQYFFETIDTNWDEMLKRPVAVQLGDSVVAASDEVAEYIRTGLKRITEPTPQKIQAFFDELTKEGVLEVVSSKLGSGFEDTLQFIDKDLAVDVASRLDGLAKQSAKGPLVVTMQEIDEVFDEAAAEMVRRYNQMIESGLKAFDDMLPEMPATADEMYKVLTRGVEKPTLEDLARAVDDMPAVALRYEKDVAEATAAHWEAVRQAKEAGKSAVEIGKMHDEFFLKKRPQMWEEFVTKQRECFEKIAQQVESLVDDAEQVSALRGLFDEYLDTTDALNKLELRRAQLRQRFGQMTGAGLWEEAQLATKKADNIWRRNHPKLKAKVHDTLVSIRYWFETQGLKAPEPLDLHELARGVGWWRVEQQLKDVPESAYKMLKRQFDELEQWRRAVLETRVRPFETVSLTDVDRTIVQRYAQQLVGEVKTLIDDAIDSSIERVNNLLFDYETTPNWMNVLHSFVPFVRFPVKNTPLWIEKFATIPHLPAAVATIRQLQAAINARRNVPARHQYSVALPRWMTDWFMEALGFHNTELRFNPWSFFSAMQQLPGGTPYKSLELRQLYENEEDNVWHQQAKTVTTYMRQLGFGMWPWVEWTLGMQGLLGDDWYPRGVFSTWLPVVNWALSEVFGYDKTYDIDVHMRRLAPRFWNAVFGKTPLDWKTLTPDLMEQWVTGREVEGVIMRLPDDPEALAQLTELTPMQQQAIVRGLQAKGTLEDIRRRVALVFDMPLEQQAEAIKAMTVDERAVFLDEMQRIAVRLQVRKSAFTTLVGNLFGLYLEPANMAEIEARKLRYEKRREKELLDVGPEQRDFEKAFRAEHPKYGLIQTWRFGQYPWGEEAASREAEVWDAVIQDATSEYWRWREQHDAAREAAIEEFYRAHPGDKHGLRALKAQFVAEREAKEKELNERLMEELRRRMREYERKYPEDDEGIKKLREGFETEMYVGTHLTPEQRRILREYQKANPDNKEGLDRLFSELWEEAKRLNPPTQKKRWPGLDNGFTLNLKWNPNSYNDEEVQRRLIGDVIRALGETAPDRDDYEDGNAYWQDFLKWKDSLPEKALELPDVQNQIELLMQNGGLSREEAEETVKSWYTADEYDKYWRQFHTKWEALENAYQERWISDIDDEWYNEILPLREQDYNLYRAAKEELFARYGQIPATDLIPYIMDMYPGRWTVAELQQAFEGIMMPSYQQRRLLRNTGETAVNGYIWYYYNRLPGEAKRLVRQKFGEPFTELFLNDRQNEVSIELRGDWLTALAGMFGEEMDWRSLPGVDRVVAEKGGKSEARTFGLPKISPTNEGEFERAMEIEREYWRLRADGDPAYKQLENDPLRKKYFGTSTPKGYFWSYYYDNIPPGWAAKELRDHPAVAIVLDQDVRYAVAEDSDYDRAIEVMENWLMFNADRLAELGFNPKEYDEARQLIKRYYEIPKENKAERRAFIEANPLLKKYLFKPDSAGGRGGGGGSRGGGGGGGRGPTTRVDSSALWTAFTQRVGGSFATVMRMLVRYWNTGAFPGVQSEQYLRALHAEVGGGLSFEEWLAALRRIWIKRGSQSASGFRSVGKPKAPPRPRYDTDYIRGRRKM